MIWLVKRVNLLNILLAMIVVLGVFCQEEKEFDHNEEWVDLPHVVVRVVVNPEYKKIIVEPEKKIKIVLAVCGLGFGVLSGHLPIWGQFWLRNVLKEEPRYLSMPFAIGHVAGVVWIIKRIYSGEL